jgi:hypothetical protein
MIESRWAIVGATVLALCGSRTARAECLAIAAIPTVISVPGHYCLTSDLTTDMSAGTAISIEANSVVLDLQGHRVGGLGAGPLTEATAVTMGIPASGAPVANVTIRNGTVRGFSVAVDAPWGASFVLLEDLRLDSAWDTAVAFASVRSLTVRRSVIKVPETPYPLPRDRPRFGVRVSAAHAVRLLDNDIDVNVAQGAGLTVTGADAVFVERNRISCQGYSTTSAIVLEGTRGTLVLGNRSDACGKGIAGALDGATAFRFGDNIAGGASRYQGGTDIGNNR